MRNTMWVSLVTLFLLCLAGSAAQAQDSRLQVFGGYSFATHSCFGTCVLDEVKDPGLHGYTAAFVYNFNSHLGLEANFSGHNGTPTIEHDYPTPFGTGEIDKQNQNLYIYTFGPRLSIDVGDFSLFAHFLVGGTHVSGNAQQQCTAATGEGGETCGSTANVTTDTLSGSGFATKIGGGVDWNHKRWGIRILEVDYLDGQFYATDTPVACPDCAKTSEDTSGAAFELSTGLTFNFGGTE